MVMGDWAKGEFTAAVQTAVMEYGCMLGPQGDSIILTGDMFTFPKIDAQRPGWLPAAATMQERGTQAALKSPRGACARPWIPVSARWTNTKGDEGGAGPRQTPARPVL